MKLRTALQIGISILLTGIYASGMLFPFGFTVLGVRLPELLPEMQFKQEYLEIPPLDPADFIDTTPEMEETPDIEELPPPLPEEPPKPDPRSLTEEPSTLLDEPKADASPPSEETQDTASTPEEQPPPPEVLEEEDKKEDEPSKKKKKKDEKPCPPEPSPYVSQIGPNHWTIHRDLLEYYARHLGKITSELGYTWTRRDSQEKPIGFWVGPHKCSVLRQAGFRWRDTVLTINGRKIATIWQGIGFYFAERKSTEFEVVLTRRGREDTETLHFTVIDDPKVRKRDRVEKKNEPPS